MIFYLIVRVLILIYINPGSSELPVKTSTTNFWLPKVNIKINIGDCRNTTRHRVITAKIVIYSCYSAFILSSLEAVGRGKGGKSSNCSWKCRTQTKRRGLCARCRHEVETGSLEGQRRYSQKSSQLVCMGVDIEDTDQEGLDYGREAEWLNSSISLSPHSVETNWCFHLDVMRRTKQDELPRSKGRSKRGGEKV
jgi:hypothetical protein